MLHFADDHESNSDRLWKLREVINRLRRSFTHAFHPYQTDLLLYKDFYKTDYFLNNLFHQKEIDSE